MEKRNTGATAVSDHGIVSLGSQRLIPMKTIYDAASDALYVRFAEATVVESEEVSDGVIFDYDADGRIVAIELLDASKHVAAGATFPSAAE